MMLQALEKTRSTSPSNMSEELTLEMLPLFRDLDWESKLLVGVGQKPDSEN